MENPERYYTFEEARAYLGIERTRLKEAKKRGEVRACQNGKLVRFRRCDLDAFWKKDERRRSKGKSGW